MENGEKEDKEEKEERYLQYLKTVPMEFKAMLIAKDHLGSSFDLIRSNGFQTWVKTLGKL